MKLLYPLLFALTLSACGGSDSDSQVPETPETTPPVEPTELVADICYVMSTTMGDISLAIDTTNTPITGANFKRYVDEQFYDGTLFHRVVYQFVSQGGGFTTGLVSKPGFEAITLEDNVGLTNARGTIAMARTTVADSATSQFYINALDNPQLDYSSGQRGYAVFGQVYDGMAEVVDQINMVSINSNSVPVTDIVINSVEETSCPQ
ncbi:peptidylprolyl isomerase [Pseudomonadota bacterium]|uniref:peptidylprolyl isomerase n=1 Tax=unclassified Shewanella TaxID=196818 RepID=UPI000C82D772|nr:MULTISPECIES: peptidylprolyl isomerase [unclassified Shewanella]MDO6641147.1 peptidylprolyl isomerase [Shewanella sp. 5_MG-2023]MDO6678559.1 peptidylprolyl isomerase [Shewanella sp. 4_MG-2023]PMG31993.1 peptidylprolyl isomerase [Shewanella sp. 10N.286.52.C2]PMH85999.1 peptidylprolyl isomerase [Shewanella sp. 10N.286.48.B5]PMI01223.1 peptidylprolyl isomerase [Shewanella sp. 10N.286.48.A6]